jgi:hypothetical protein
MTPEKLNGSSISNVSVSIITVQRGSQPWIEPRPFIRPLMQPPPEPLIPAWQRLAITLATVESTLILRQSALPEACSSREA